MKDNIQRNEAEELVRAIMNNDNLKAAKNLESILKAKCAKKIAAAHKA